MSLELVIRPEAEADALEAYRRYSEQLPADREPDHQSEWEKDDESQV